MNAQRNRRKWKNMLAYPGFQLRLALTHCVFVVAVVLILVASLLSTFYLDVQGSDELWARYASAELLLRLFGRFGSAILVIIVTSIIYHIMFSHRLCGPLVNIRQTIERITKGDVTRKIFLRRTDFLKEEAAAINSMLTKVDERISSLKSIHAEITEAALQLPKGSEEDHIRALLDQQERLLEQWIVNSSAFKVQEKRNSVQ